MLIDQTAIHIAASKSPAYRCRVWARFEALLSFLSDQGWIGDSVVARYSSDREHFELHDTDLSAVGRDFIVTNYDKWLRKVDQGDKTRSPGELYGMLKKLAEN